MNSIIEQALPLPEIYFSPLGGYYRRESRGNFIPVNEGQAKSWLKEQGYSDRDDKDGVSEIASVLLRVQNKQNIDFAGGLAGHTAGYYSMNGAPILVTNSPKLLERRPGEWPTLQHLLEGMFRDAEHDQLAYFNGWLKMAVEAVYGGNWQPSQVLVLAGPVESCKSLLQQIITEALGGRAAFAHNYFSGGSNFNGELFQAEHLMIEDEAECANLHERRSLGARLKQVAVNRKHYCHAKNRQPLSLEPIWRLSISLNDDPERLRLLPPLDPDIEDKLMLLKVSRPILPFLASTSGEKERFWNTLMSELPAYLHYLMNWEIPPQMRVGRCGIRHFHHPELVMALDTRSEVTTLLGLINREIWAHPEKPRSTWEGKAHDLIRRLDSTVGHLTQEERALLKNAQTLGILLRRLQQDKPRRISSKIRKGHQVWVIQPPECELDPDTAQPPVGVGSA